MNRKTTSNHTPRKDEFLSEEDLDLQNLDEREIVEWWNLWLQNAQATNNEDKNLYSHGVFRIEPGAEGGLKGEG